MFQIVFFLMMNLREIPAVCEFFLGAVLGRYVIITKRKPNLFIYDLSAPIYWTVRNIKLCKIEMVSLHLGIFSVKRMVKHSVIGLQFK